MKFLSTFLTKALFTTALALFISASASAGSSSNQSYEEQVQEMYIAYYSRPGDPGGVAYWASQLEKSNGDLSKIIDQFGNSAEYSERFQGLTDEELVNNIYQNLFGRDSDSAGLNFYTRKLISGDATLASIALTIVNGVTEGSTDSNIILNKIAVAIAYSTGIESSGTTYGQEQIDDAILMISSMDSEETSLAVVLEIVSEAFSTDSEIDITALIASDIFGSSYAEKKSALETTEEETSIPVDETQTETEVVVETPAPAEETTTEEVVEETPTEVVAETPAPAEETTTETEETAEEVVTETPAPEEETPSEVVALKSISINWSIPSARENGDDLFPYEIGGYEVLYKKTDDTLYTSEIINDSQTVSLDIEGLSPGDYEIKIASFDTENLLSDYQSVTITII
jgi:hypothetical protein